ncbi:Glycosyl transferase family 11 [Trinorchestia longiramus]|nr:Glycosyl transferase family 11 [Trinorchestia longiramus]
MNSTIHYFDALAKLEAGSPLPPYTLLTTTPCRISLLWSIRDYWREKLVFKPALKKTVVGVHVRRGDIIHVLKRHYGKKQLLPPAYYHSAFNYYRQRFGGEVIFVILTQKSERDWCRKFLSSVYGDVIVMDDNASGEQDVVQLSMFQHLIYSHGTFGLWGILQSDAQTVVYPDKASDAGLKRYSHHIAFDFIRDKVPGTQFVTVTF